MRKKQTIAAAEKILHYKKGQDIFKEGDEVQGIYFIREGAVKVHQTWGDNEFILRFAVAGDVIGHRGQGLTVFPISATALESASVSFVTNAALETRFLTDGPFVYTMMQLYATELQKAERRMRDLALMPVKGRVAGALLTMREVFGLDEQGYIRVPVTRLDIACYAGTTYEAVFRLLTEWSREGLVSTSGKSIKINDDHDLQHFNRVTGCTPP